MFQDKGKPNLYATTVVVAQRFSFVLKKLRTNEDTGWITVQLMLELFYCQYRALVVVDPLYFHVPCTCTSSRPPGTVTEGIHCEYTTGKETTEEKLINQLILSVTYFCQDKGKPLCHYRGDSIEVYLHLKNPTITVTSSPTSEIWRTENFCHFPQYVSEGWVLDYLDNGESLSDIFFHPQLASI